MRVSQWLVLPVSFVWRWILGQLLRIVVSPPTFSFFLFFLYTYLTELMKEKKVRGGGWGEELGIYRAAQDETG